MIKSISLFVLIFLSVSFTKAQDQPNVLFLMTDEHSPNALACYGNNIVKTPNLDAIAASGTMFTNAYCQDPICVPSRVSLITGMMPSKLGVRGNQDSLFYSATLPNIFKKAGYTTEWYGKEHWGNSNIALGFGGGNEALMEEISLSYQEARKFAKDIGRLPQDATTYTFSEENDFEGLVATGAVEFLKKQSKTDPFFLGVSFKKPHFPFICNIKYADLYINDIDLPLVTQEMKEDWTIAEQKESDKWGFETMSDEEIKRARAMYYGMVTYIDEQIGRIINELKEQGLYENTIVIYISDHGEMNGEHGLWYKNSFYDASVSVPFIWSYPNKIKESRVDDTPVMIIDILPTLCDLCNLEKPKNLSGKSIAPMLMCGSREDDRAAYSETYRSNSYGYMIRKGDWKYCWFALEEGRLYNMKEDPQELNNLISDQEHKTIVEELRKELSAVMNVQLN